MTSNVGEDEGKQWEGRHIIGLDERYHLKGASSKGLKEKACLKRNRGYLVEIRLRLSARKHQATLFPDQGRTSCVIACLSQDSFLASTNTQHLLTYIVSRIVVEPYTDFRSIMRHTLDAKYAVVAAFAPGWMRWMGKENRFVRRIVKAESLN